MPRPLAAPRQASLHGHLAMLAFSALVAGSFSLGAMAAPYVDPAALTTLRFVIASVIVGTAALTTNGFSRCAFAAPWRYLILGGLLAIYFVLMFEGLKTAAPVSTAAVFTLTPLLAAGFGWILLRQRTTPRMALALTIGAAGAAWVIFRADWQALMGFHIGGGEMIYFWGCVCHAVYAPMVRKLNRGESAVVFSFGTMVAGTLVLALWAWPALCATNWAAMPPIVWITLAYVSVAASAATFVLLQYASLRLPSAKVMAYTYLTPSWVILWEIALGRGVPPVGVLAGIAMTILALYLLLEE
ncbi:DMT family transporter [Pseudorhodobacter wandonensis]|uniref:DMT family transporter n=1 Tax=Pseudorhodobacter wandonensis TaxID=1120568 RepID=UPI0009E5EE8A|nr:DMT family transporter [Pseudorhodobacter wandonensis]